MDLRRIREETRPEHEATEAAMPLMAPGLTPALYVDTLRRLWPVLRGWEEWAALAAPASVRTLLAARRRSQWLALDLQMMGVPDADRDAAAAATSIDWTAVIGGSGELDPAKFEAAFLGAFYVMEGSTLGGRFIAKHLEAELGLKPGQGDAYFQGHGEETGRIWRETTAVIRAVPEAYAPLLIAAAKRTFAAFGAALLENWSADTAKAGPV